MAKICSIDGCGRKHYAKSLCKKHYQRLHRNGSLLKPVREQNAVVHAFIVEHPLEYNSYRAMFYRCTNKSSPDYKNYGGRGIKICDRWHGEYGFVFFLQDLGKRPDGKHGGMPKYSIDRINPDGDYCPENCRWSDWYTQAAHRRSEGDVPGVYKRGHSFVANIQNKTTRKTKTFKTLDEAIAQRRKWEKELL